MTETLNVEFEELTARAAELEQPLPTIPSDNPQGPCALSFVNDAAVQLALSADSMRLYLKACEREWKILAKSLSNAAKAYEEVDEGAAEAINDDPSTSEVTAASVGGNDEMAAYCDPDEDFSGYLPPPPAPPPPFEYPYYDVRQAAVDIEAGDQGAAFEAFANEWDAFQREFQKETYRFRPFTSWEGEARSLVEQNFEQQRQWIYAMVSLCSSLATQAKKVVDAHKKARISKVPPWDKVSTDAEHPTTYEVSQADYWYRSYTERRSPYLYMAIEWYERLQRQSETSLSNYIQNASIPLTPVNPKTPPTATAIDLTPPPPEPTPTPPPPVPTPPPPVPTPPPPEPTPTPPPPEPTPAPPPNIWDEILGEDVADGTLPDPTGMPVVPSAGGLPPTPDTAAMTDAMKDALKGGPALPTGGGVKPASFGGGAGAPGMPLQPPIDAEAASRPAGAAAAGGSGLPGGAGGAMRGGGMGMAPMAPGAGGQQGGDKNKRSQSEEESLYTEERHWTEGVIGNRPRKSGPDK